MCDKRLLKALTDLDIADAQIKARDAEIVNAKALEAKQNERFVEVLGILKDYAALDNQKKKSFWSGVRHKLVDILDGMTSPEGIRAILVVIALIQAGK